MFMKTTCDHVNTSIDVSVRLETTTAAMLVAHLFQCCWRADFEALAATFGRSVFVHHVNVASWQVLESTEDQRIDWSDVSNKK